MVLCFTWDVHGMGGRINSVYSSRSNQVRLSGPLKLDVVCSGGGRFEFGVARLSFTFHF